MTVLRRPAALALLAFAACGRSAPLDTSVDASSRPLESVAFVDSAKSNPSLEVTKLRRWLTFDHGDVQSSLLPSLLPTAAAHGFERVGEAMVPSFDRLVADEVALGTHADRPWIVGWKGVKARIRLAGARAVSAATTASGEAVFGGILPSATMTQLALPTGVEDLVRFDAPPNGEAHGARSELRYSLELEGVAGLRLVSGVLELLDAGGAPRVRTLAPIVIDSARRVVAGELAVEGCAYDTSRELPYGRPLVAPGARSCVVVARWSDAGLTYPIVVDPSWTTTGKLVQSRYGFGAAAFNTASGACSTGCVLAAGGHDIVTRAALATKTAEIYSVATGTWTLTDEIPDGAHGEPGVAATGEGRVMLAGGTNGLAPIASAYLYDSTSAAGAKWTSVGPLPHGARQQPGAAGFLLPHFGGNPFGKDYYDVVFAGGLTAGGAPSGDVDVFATTASGVGAWSTTSYPAMTVPRSQHATVAYATASTVMIGQWNPYVIVAGGTSSTTTDTVEVLDLSAGSWGPVMHLSGARRDLAGVVLDRLAGYVLFAGGVTGVGAGATVRGDVDMVPAQVPTTVSKLGVLSVPRSGLRAAAFTGTGVKLHAVFAGGGVPFAPVADSDTVEMDGGTFATAKSTMNYARKEHQVVTLLDGSVMALGGYTDSGITTAPLYEEIIVNAANGAACKYDGDCKSLHCVDGVCCNTTCANQCEACNVAGSLGSCSPVSGAPHGARPACAGSNATCKGVCDGTAAHVAACQFAGSGVKCVSASCAGGTATSAAYCNGSGDCNTPTSTACVRYACGPTACLTSCAKNADCATGFRCDLGSGSATYAQCISSGAAGSPCDPAHMPSDCTSGLSCVDKVCCATASCPTGYACNVVGDPGKCHLPQGQACGTAAAPAADCVGGNCVDGVCCNTACAGQCQYCDATGACQRTLSGPPHGSRPACTGSGACAAQCDGSSDVTCGGFPGTGVVCKTESCGGMTDQPTSYCDGTGGCALKPTVNCTPYTCGATACKMSCTSPADCAAGYTCSGASCVPKIGIACKVASDCTSGYCIDGYCCDSACSGQCQACDVPGAEGKCAALVGEQPHGARTKCSDGGGDLCKALQCDGSKDVTKCVSYANGPDKLCVQSCAAGTLSVAYCDGLGSCGAAMPTTCGPYACDSKTCKTTCASDADCAAKYTCDAAAKKCAPAPDKPQCRADGLSSISADKSTIKPCGAYACNPTTGDCYAACTASEQCAPGAVCDGKSCAQQAPDTSSSGGCAVGERAPAGGAWWLATLAVALFGARRAKARANAGRVRGS